MRAEQGAGGGSAAVVVAGLLQIMSPWCRRPSSVIHHRRRKPTSLRLYRTYLHNLLADIIDLLGYTVLVLIKTGVTEIEI